MSHRDSPIGGVLVSKQSLMAALVLLPCVTYTAETPSLDDEFLEYLADFENPSDDWAWFADDDRQVAPAPAKKVTRTPDKAVPKDTKQ